MRTAIIDLGTNTFHLLISEGRNTILEERRAVRIGMGGINSGKILPDALDRAVACLLEYRRLADMHQAGRLLAFGTSALRNASNRNEVCTEIFRQTGIHIEVISGDREAELIWEGIRSGLDLGSGPSLIVDIGGGSVEFIIADSLKIRWKVSLEIGGQRMLELFKPSDPVLRDEIVRIDGWLEEKLKYVDEAIRQHRPEILIGSSGSFDTFSEIHCKREGISYPDSPETPLTFESLDAIHHDLIRLDRPGRMLIPGMIELRVDMIVMASLLVDKLRRIHRFSDIQVSSYSLKEGIRAVMA